MPNDKENGQAPADLVIRTPLLNTVTELVRSLIALAVIGGGITVIILSITVRTPDLQQAIQGSVTVTVGLMGAVLGYYFGSRGIDHALATAATVLKEREILDETAHDAIDEVNQKLRKQQSATKKILAWVKQSNDNSLKNQVRTLKREDLGL